jgi:HEAT repeat protein
MFSRLSKLTTKSFVAFGFGVAVALFATGDAFAHGGSHPTPWPQPPGDPTPSPSPSPSPTPGSTPSTGSKPTRGTPTTPSGPSTGGLSGPSGPSGPKASTGKPSGEMVWEHWWQLNQWNYTRVGRRGTQSSGGEGDGTAESPVQKFLKEALKDKYFDVRSAAAIAIGKASQKASVDALLPLLDDSNPGVQESAILALGMLKDTRNIPHLLKVIENRGKYKDAQRATAALAMGFIGDKAATSSLVDVLNKSTDEEIRAAAVVALGLLKDDSAVEPLYKLISVARGKNVEKLRAYAVTALGKLGIPEFTPQGSKKKVSVTDLLKKLMHTDKSKQVKRSAVLALGALGGEKYLNDLIKKVKADRDPMVRNFAMIALARLAESDRAKRAIRQELERVLMGKDYSGKGFAALSLGLLGDKAGARALQRAFKEQSDPSNRSAAAIGLGLLKDESSAMNLLSQIQLSRDSKIRGYCCVALGMMQAKQAVPEMRRILTKEKNPELRAAAAIALANMSDPEGMEILRKALDDKNSYLKMTTALALGYFRDDKVVPDLTKAFAKEKNNEVRAIMTVALGYIVDPNEVPVLKQVATDFNYLLHYPSIDLVLRLF